MISLIAKDGYVWTDGETYSEAVYLSCYDSPDNWEEITKEEAEERQNGGSK